MATVNKNFRIKNGLVVEGNTATVNGFDILTKSTADESYIVDLIGGTATSVNDPNTVVKRDASGNFAAGVITADLTGDVTGTVSDISNHTTTNLTEGTNLYYTAARAKEEAANLLANATKTNIVITKDGSNNLTITAENGVADSTTDDLDEGTTNLYFTNTRARNAISGGTGISYDSGTGVISVDSTIATKTYADGAASAAQSAAEANAATNTTNQINALDTDDIEEGATNKYFSNTLARGAVSAGTGLNYNSGTGEFSVDTSTIAEQSWVTTQISNLVDGAPALLDTLNELAAAINDDASFATTITNSIGEKVAKSGDTMTGALTLSGDPTNALHAATKQYVDSEASSAQTAAETTAQNALNNVLDGDTDFTAIDVNSVSRQIAATTGNIATAAVTTVISWDKTAYRSAKILVKAKNGTHTHVSELVATLDTSDNIALTEYGITTTNGSLISIDADIDSGNVRIRVNPTYNNTEVMAHATLIV